MAKNIHRHVLDLAKKKYGTDVSISKMVKHCERYVADMPVRNDNYDPLLGCKKGLAGEAGYTASMWSINLDALKAPLEHMTMLIRFTAVFDVLVASLQELGEVIDY